MPELLQRLQQLAQQQSGLNGQLQGLLPGSQSRPAGEGLDAAEREQARQLARAQRDVARQLEEAAGADPSGRAQELAREARAIAQALDQGAVDPAQAARQERLLRRMLDAGRSLEQDQQDESQRRESRTARTAERFAPGATVEGTAAQRFAVPTWEELRGLSAEDRRLVIEYFRRLNAEARP
jgi:Zn-dependent oligopeptidase